MMPDPGANDALAPERPARRAVRRPATTCTWRATRCCARARARAASSAIARGLRPGHDGLRRPLVGGAALARVPRPRLGAGLLLPNADEARALTGESPTPSAAARRLCGSLRRGRGHARRGGRAVDRRRRGCVARRPSPSRDGRRHHGRGRRLRRRPDRRARSTARSRPRRWPPPAAWRPGRWPPPARGPGPSDSPYAAVRKPTARWDRASGQRRLAPAAAHGAGHEPTESGDQGERQRDGQHADEHAGEAHEQVARVADRVVEGAAHGS